MAHEPKVGQVWRWRSRSGERVEDWKILSVNPDNISGELLSGNTARQVMHSDHLNVGNPRTVDRWELIQDVEPERISRLVQVGQVWRFREDNFRVDWQITMIDEGLPWGRQLHDKTGEFASGNHGLVGIIRNPELWTLVRWPSEAEDAA